MNTKSQMENLLGSKKIPSFPDLAGKVALVTGSSRGIGAETALYLAANKVKVVVNGRDKGAVDSMVAQIKSNGGEALGCVADCTKYKEIEEMRTQIEKSFGVVNLLFAFAGESSAPKSIEELPEERWNSIINLNLTSKFLTVKSFLPSMKKSGKGGSIILMSSSAGRAPSEDALDYTTAQAGVIMLTQNLAQQLGKDNIRVNAVAPCTIHNEKLDKEMTPEEQRLQASTYTISRLGKPSDVASAALFLSSESASWITGTVMDINGGGMHPKPALSVEPKPVPLISSSVCIPNSGAYFSSQAVNISTHNQANTGSALARPSLTEPPITQPTGHNIHSTTPTAR